MSRRTRKRVVVFLLTAIGTYSFVNYNLAARYGDQD